MLLIIGALFCGLFSLWLGKDLNWDAFNYHFYNGWAAWTGHIWANIAPAQLQSFLNPALDIPQYLMIAHLPAWCVGFIIGAFQGLSFFLVVAIIRSVEGLGRSIADTALLIIAGASALAGPVTISEYGSTMGDFTLSVPVLLAVLLTVRSFQARMRRNAISMITVAGLLIGATTGLKYTMAVYGVAAACSLLICPPPAASRLKIMIPFSLAGLIGFLVTAGPWMAVLRSHYDSPLFPFFNAWFRSPYAKQASWFNSGFTFTRWTQWLTFPFSLLHEGQHHLQIPFRSIRLAVASCCLISSTILDAVLWWRYRDRQGAVPGNIVGRLSPAQHWMLLYFGLSYLVWAKVFGDYRYFLTSEIFCPVVIVIPICQITQVRAARVTVVALMTIAMAMFVSVGSSWGRGAWAGSSYFGVGLPSTSPEKDSMVLMTGIQPMAFMVPYFGGDIRFVRVQSNFDPVETPLYRQLVQRTVTSYRGFLYLLTTEPEVAGSTAIIRQYGLLIMDGSCEPVRSLYGLKVVLCRLARREG
ncbi:MAG: hypothetical protein JO122_13125, partial [Acetobacteraceae bacterium]|nr:hypothetical protein [Acetobacteraceae bacterium]